MGCKNLEKEMSSSKNKIVYSINGNKEETNFKKINEIFNQTAKKKIIFLYLKIKMDYITI